MHRFTHWWGHNVVRYRLAILITTVLLMFVAPLSFDRIYYDNSNESYFVEHDPNLVAYDQLQELYGDTEYLMIGIPARDGEDVFNADTIAMIDTLTQFLEAHRYVTQVRSLSKYQYTHDDEGLLATDDLFEDLDNLRQDPAVMDQARDIMRGEPLALGTLVTDDFQHTRIAARVETRKNEGAHYVELVTELNALIDEAGFREQGYTLHLSGIPVINERFETLTKTDQAVLNPAMGVMMMLILFLVFRSFFATLVPLVVIISTLFFLTSVQGVLAFPTTAVSSALIPTMIILSMGASVHVLVEFFQARRRGLSPREAAAETTSDLFRAILFTSLTTALGFIALSITELRPVRQFAILAAIGPMLIFILTVTTLPAVLSYIPWMPRNSKKKENAVVSQWLEHRLPKFTYTHRKGLALLGLIITLFSLYSIQHIRVDANVINYFKSNSWVNRDLHYFNEHFKGIANLEVVIDTGEEGGVKNPELLQRADALQHYLEAQSETGNALSVLDFYKQINQSLNGDDTAWYQLPDSRPLAAQFLLLYENTGPDEDLSDLKDFDERYLRISIPVINMDETTQTAFLKNIEAHLEREFGDLSLVLTGSLVMNNAQNVYVNNGMFQSFGVAIVVIGISFLFLFASLKHGVIALLPSVIPVILTGGLISYAGVALDLGTMIVGAMTIGIAVDDSIHVMSRYRLLRHRGQDTYNALCGALRSSGRAVMLTSLILITGFSVMLFGNFIPFIYVGLFSAMIMSFALIGDLIFMPALLFLFDDTRRSAEAENPTQPSGAIENA